MITLEKAVCGALLVTLFMGITLSFGTKPAMSESTTVVVPDDYSTIQEAIEHANAGDTVFVRKGTYYGYIQIDKSMKLIGEDKQNTLLKVQPGTIGRMGIYILGSNVIVSGFQITYNSPSTKLILVEGGSCNEIRDNILIDEGSDVFGFLGSSGNRIENNLIVSDAGGCCLDVLGSDSNVINNNTIIGGWASIIFGVSSHNVVSNNLLVNQTSWTDSAAINFMATSTNNTVVNNRFERNDIGMNIFSSSGNHIYHNGFVENTQQACNDESINFWDNGYPSGGNYWSDYLGQDVLSGPYRNATGSDGLGDTPYVVDNRNRDEYPLMKPFTPLQGDLNGDRKVDLKDIYIVTSAYGSYPEHQRWNPLADLNCDKKVDLKDICIVYRSYGKYATTE